MGNYKVNSDKLEAYDKVTTFNPLDEIILGREQPNKLATRMLATDLQAQILSGISISTTFPISDVKITNYDIQLADYTIRFNPTSADLNANLPNAIGIAGQMFNIKNVSNTVYNVNVVPYGAQTIEGSAIVFRGESLIFQSDGTNWISLSYQKKDDLNYIINSIDDFPVDPVAGVLYLPKGKYFINRDLYLPYTISVADNESITITGSGDIIYVGGGTLFQVANMQDSLIVIDKLTIIDGIGTSKFCDITSTVPGIGILLVLVSAVVNFGELGNITGTSLGTHLGYLLQNGKGFTFEDANIISFINTGLYFWKNEVGAVFITIKGDNQTVMMSNNTFRPQSNETIFDIQAASTVVAGQVTASTVVLEGGVVFKAGSKDQTDINWVFRNNVYIPESTVSAQVNLINNATNTVISAQNVWTKINGNNAFVSEDLERISVSSDGVATYNGLEIAKLALDGNIFMAQITAINLQLETTFLNIHAHDDIACTFDNTLNRINSTAHGFSDDDVIIFYNSAGTLPAELRKDEVYYIINSADDYFQVSYTQGGAAVAFTDDGSGSNTFNEVCFVGAIARQTVDSTTRPMDILPQGLAELETGDQVMVVIRNASGDQDILVSQAYYREIKV